MKNHKRYIIFHKPWGVLSQFTTELGHRTLLEFNLPKGVYAAGRLDKDSEGLLLLTNDGPFIKKFLDTHPRQYWAQVDHIPTPETLEKLSRGVSLKDGMTLPCQVKLLNPTQQIPPRNPPIRVRKNIPTSWIELTLTEGKNRQVRRMTAHVGHPTLRLLRVGLGGIKLNLFEDLLPGQWREVSPDLILKKT